MAETQSLTFTATSLTHDSDFYSSSKKTRAIYGAWSNETKKVNDALPITGTVTFSNLGTLKGKIIKSIALTFHFRSVGASAQKTIKFTNPSGFIHTTSGKAYNRDDAVTYTSGVLLNAISSAANNSGEITLTMFDPTETNTVTVTSTGSYSTNHLAIDEASMVVTYEDSPPVYYYNGSSWIPAKIHYHNGSTWIESKAKFYNNGWPN